MHRRVLLPLLPLLALVSAGCVTPLSERDVEDQLARAAEPVTRQTPTRVFPIWAETKLLAYALLTEARSDSSSDMSLHLSRRIALAAKRRMNVVVGGPYPALSDRVLYNALELAREDGLRGAKLVFVSAEPPSPELARAARDARARLYHREFR